MTANLAESDALGLAIVQVQALAVDLATRGFEAHVSRDGGTLSLNVINRASPEAARTSRRVSRMTARGGSGGRGATGSPASPR